MRMTAIGTLAFIFLTVAGDAAAAPKPGTPRVGDCFKYEADEIQFPATNRKPVNCRNLHNVETFKVVKSPFNSDPNLEAPISLSVKVSPICGAGILKSQFFNAWSFKIPTKSEWKSGARWLRCEAFVIVNDSETVTIKSWKGKKLDFK